MIKKSYDDYYNANRKRILENLEKNIYVSNQELSLYDLNPYINISNDLSQNLTDMIISNNVQRHRIEHINGDVKRFFIPLQYEFLEKIKNNSRVIVSAPTSFGKTMIVKEYIYKCKPQNVVFIVPTNALAYELENSFKSNDSFKNYLIFDKKKDNSIISDGYNLFIGTQEKYLEIVDCLPNEIDCFIIDEAYKLDTKIGEQRGYKLSEAFLNSISQKSKKIILLSPNAKFVGFDKFNFALNETKFNAVDKVFTLVDKENFYNAVIEASENEKTILYCDKPQSLSKIYSHLITEKSVVEDDFIRQLEEDFHPEWNVIKFLKKGILTHHGVMPKYIQNKMLNSFNYNPNYNLLIGTNSISEGINTPTKNLFIDPDCAIRDDDLLLKNTIGRAGRLGQYPIGHIYSVNKIEESAKKDIVIKLTVSNDDEVNEILETRDNTKAFAFCEKYEIDYDFYLYLINKYKISMKKLGRVLSVLKSNQTYVDISNIVYMATEVFKEDYPYFNYLKDKFLIKGLLNYFYVINGENYSLSTFDEKIKYFRKNTDEEFTDSDIIDLYMKFNYSTLEYYICPIANICKDIYSKYPKFKFGTNVISIVNDFLAKYYKNYLRIPDFDSLNDIQKKIYMTLNEYGIPISENIISVEMINEINAYLESRYSTYDIINAIKKLSNQSNSNKNRFKIICKKYLD